jgi:NADH:ubiquinone oxidoreductase subunit D
VIREDRLLLAELGRLNTDVVPLAMRIMDESATTEEHYAFAERLVAMARRLQDRAAHVGQGQEITTRVGFIRVGCRPGRHAG